MTLAAKDWDAVCVFSRRRSPLACFFVEEGTRSGHEDDYGPLIHLQFHLQKLLGRGFAFASRCHFERIRSPCFSRRVIL